MRTITLFAFTVLSVLAFPSLAQVDDPDAAKAKYATGVRHFDLSEFEQALLDFKEAYRKKPDPVFLYNIAQCHRKLGHSDDAITFYQTYLRRAPDAKNREEVERRITELEPLRNAQEASIASPTGDRVQPLPASEGARETAAAQAVSTTSTTPALDLGVRDEAAKEPASTVYSKWWFWTAVGAVAAGTATIVAILATRDPTKVPTSTLGSQRALP